MAGILVPRVIDREREAMPSQTIDGGISHLAARPDAVQRAADKQDWAVDSLDGNLRFRRHCSEADIEPLSPRRASASDDE